MGEKLALRLPKGLTTPPTGVRLLTFPVEIVGNRFADGWRRRCRIEGLEDDRGRPIAAEFQRSGRASLRLPADVAGEVTVVFELENPRFGRRLQGDLSLHVDRHEGSGPIHVVAGNHHVEGSGVVYQPIEIKGASSQVVEVAGDKLSCEIDLYEENLGGAVSIEDLAERRELVVLPDRGDGIARVLSIDLGPDLVIGRCYFSQLHERARTRLEQAGLDRVHWVTCWDDPALNQVSARLLFRPGLDEHLEVHNLTDYSSRRQPVGVAAPGESSATVAPGEHLEVEVASERWLEVGAGEGTNRRVLARLEFEQILCGSSPVPVFRTANTTFRFPPNGGLEAIMVHFLGVWIPWEPARLRELLEIAGAALTVAFDRDEVYLWIEYRRSERRVSVSGNIDLRACLAAR